jgi:hypothetical protein
MVKANYSIICNVKNALIIQDDGPWDDYKTITNDVEYVVNELYTSGLLNNNKVLLYVDSDNELAIIRHCSGQFLEFASI